LEHLWKTHKEKKPQNLGLSPPVDKPIAWFDGEAQNNGNKCGVGGIIKINASNEYRWTLNCGCGSNTRAELLGAWSTLVLAERLSIYDIHIMGDSKIVIEWLKKDGELRVASLEAWKERIVEICTHFRSITFEHIYKEMNQEADYQSKQAFFNIRGKITYTLWVEGHKGPTLYISL
jgi:ribonuclease HI